MKLPFEISENQARPEFFPPAVASDGRLLIDLAGTVLEVRSGSDFWLAEARDRYGSFVCDEATPEITITHTGDEAEMTAQHGCLSVIHPGGRSAEIAASKGTDILDGVLRTLLPSVIAPDLMVHGALLSDGTRGFLCCGVSGSGKSTMAALFPEAALCDEMVRLAVGPEIEVRSLPFWRARPGTVSLGAIFILEHGADNRRTPLNTSEAIRDLRRHIYWPVEQTDLMAEVGGILFDVCRDTPVFRLAFRPEPTVWATMTEGL